MAKITEFKSYQGDKPPTIPKPDEPVDPMIVTVQDGVPVVYPGCHGAGRAGGPSSQSQSAGQEHGTGHVLCPAPCCPRTGLARNGRDVRHSGRQLGG